MSDSNKLCIYFKTGNCRYGEDCDFLHISCNRCRNPPNPLCAYGHPARSQFHAQMAVNRQVVHKPTPVIIPQQHAPSHYHCYICDSTCTSQQQLHEHYQGKAHQLKVNETCPFRCDTCDVNCTSQVQLAQHFRGKSHQDKSGILSEKKVSDGIAKAASHPQGNLPDAKDESVHIEEFLANSGVSRARDISKKLFYDNIGSVKKLDLMRVKCTLRSKLSAVGLDQDDIELVEKELSRTSTATAVETRLPAPTAKEAAPAAIDTEPWQSCKGARGIFNVLVIGETGSGKSTLINTLTNFFKGGTLDKMKIAIPTRFFPRSTERFQHSERSVTKTSESQTDECTQYQFCNLAGRVTVNIIDSPGLGTICLARV